MSNKIRVPLVKKVDSAQLYVDDLDAGLDFYGARLGHELVWRSESAAGLRLPETDAEIVLRTHREVPETDLVVASADDAASHFEAAGGSIIVRPFDIRIGRCVVVEDPWGNRLGLLDRSNGSLVTDAQGKFVGTTGEVT